MSFCECVQCGNRSKTDKHRKMAMDQTRRSSQYAFSPDWRSLAALDKRPVSHVQM
jgi:hypothetical protein